MGDKPVITLLGGGSGQSNILRGLKNFDIQINSIITMADDGGSSGVLRNELHMLPPGDVRNCMLALANANPGTEELFQYRFKSGSLKGHSFGNLFLAAMNDIHGDFKNAIKNTSKMLNLKGNICPVTYESISLSARLENGNVVRGESNISKESLNQKSKIDRIYIEPEVSKASEDALEAIRKANMIVVGPGSLYTSIMPVLLVRQIAEEIIESKAIKIFITNIMTESGETDGFSAKNFLLEICKNFGQNIFDYFLINDGMVPMDTLLRYHGKQQTMILYEKEDKEFFEKREVKTITRNFIDIKDNLVIHDNQEVAQTIEDIYEGVYKKKLVGKIPGRI